MDDIEACTLPTAERPLRLAEFDAVFARVVERDRVGPHHLRLTLDGPPDLADTVRDLAAREQLCCAFFTFGVTETAGHVLFDIEVPPAQVAVLDALAAR